MSTINTTITIVGAATSTNIRTDGVLRGPPGPIGPDGVVTPGLQALADEAQAAANTAGASEINAGSSAQAALTASIAATTASDSAMTVADIKADTAAGLASGDLYFSVMSATSPQTVDVYKNVAGSAILQSNFPSTAFANNARLTSGELFSAVSTFVQALNGASLIKGSDGRNIGVSIPSGSTGATSVVRIELGLQSDIARLVGGVVQVEMRFDATAGFLAAKPANAALRFQVRRGGSLVNVAPTTASEVQTGTEIVKLLTYTVLAGDQDLSPLLSVNNSSTAATHTVTLKSVVYKLLTQPVGYESWSDAHLAIRERVINAGIAANTLTSGELADAPLFAYNGQVFNGATKILDGGNTIGFLIPAGSAGGDSFVAPYFALNGAELAGATLTVTAVFQTTVDFVTESPPNTTKAQVNRGGVLSIAPTTNVREVQVGTTLTKTLSYVITSTDIAFAPTYQVITGAASAAHDRSIQISSIKYVLSGLPAGTSPADVMAGLQIDAAISTLPIDGAATDFPVPSVYPTLSAANNAAVSATRAKPNAIRVAEGVFNTEFNWLLNNNVHLIGQGIDKTTISYELPANTDPVVIAQTQTLYANNSHVIQGVKITCKNMRYPIHSDSSGLVKNGIIHIKDAWLEHLGNQEAQDYQDSLGGAGVPVWSSEHAWGCGTSSGQQIIAENSTFKSRTSGFYVHDNANFENPCYVRLENCTHLGTNDNGAGLSIQALGAFQDNQLVLIGAKFLGDINYKPAVPWIPTDLALQPADHSQWKVSGYANAPMVFINTETGRALKIESAIDGVTSSVAVSGSAVAVIFGSAVYTLAGVTGIKGYAYGWADISGVGVGIPNVGNITSLGKRLGDCTSVNKVLEVVVDGGAPITVTFNQNYTAQTNATILAAINAALGSAATASEYNIGGRYRPMFRDEESSLLNATAEGMLMGMAAAWDGSYKKIRKMTASDAPELFAGIAWEDIYPNQLGRVKTCGWLPIADLLSVAGPLTFGQRLYVDAANPGRLTTTVGANPIMRAIRSDAVEVAIK